MSKTVEIQIEKSRNLIEGLRKHLNGIGGSVTNDEINHMEKALRELEVINSEVERLRQELSPKVKHMNEVMDGVKASYIEKKSPHDRYS